MERVCFLARVRPDRLDEYRERHKNVWPEMREALRATGWGNYSLFLRDDGLLIGYLETQDYQAALDGMAATEVNKRWQAEMAEFFVADGPPDESFQRIAEVFHLPAGLCQQEEPAGLCQQEEDEEQIPNA